MKKFFSVLLIIIITFAGCSAETRKIKLNKIVSDYLNSCNIVNSTIDSINYDEISSYLYTPPSRNLTYISEDMEDMLTFSYDAELTNDEIIDNGDIVEFKLVLLDKSDNVILSDKKIKLMIGMGYMDDETEKDLIGKTLNETYYFNASEELKSFYNTPDAEKVSITPTGIYQYIEGEETANYLSQNGFLDFQDFYSYLFDSCAETQAAEANTAAKEEFINYAIGKSTFTISNDDLNNFLNVDVKTITQSDNNLDGSIEEDEFDTFGSGSTKYEVEKYLIIGALSYHFKIDISDGDTEEFCSDYTLDYSDNDTVKYASYLCLEDKVLSEFLQLL